MKSVLLRLEGPLQSWGTQSRFQERDTDAEPSKSGVLGLCGAALGMTRMDKELLSRLCALEMAVRVDREGQMLRDYHTAGGGSWPGRKEYGVWSPDGLRPTVLSNRYYLADASFLVALGTKPEHGPDEEALVERIAKALQSPVFPLFLGRKAHVPSVPVTVSNALIDGPPIQALKQQPYGPSSFARREDNAIPERLRLVVECGPDEGRPRDDVPLSFELYNRRFARRFVKMETIRTADLIAAKPSGQEKD